MSIIRQLCERALSCNTPVLHHDDPVTQMKIIYCMCYQYPRFSRANSTYNLRENLFSNLYIQSRNRIVE